LQLWQSLLQQHQQSAFGVMQQQQQQCRLVKGSAGGQHARLKQQL
jgi:hypothetical protein